LLNLLLIIGAVWLIVIPAITVAVAWVAAWRRERRPTTVKTIVQPVLNALRPSRCADISRWRSVQTGGTTDSSRLSTRRRCAKSGPRTGVDPRSY
jgi:hypothetical protein